MSSSSSSSSSSTARLTPNRQSPRSAICCSLRLHRDNAASYLSSQGRDSPRALRHDVCVLTSQHPLSFLHVRACPEGLDHHRVWYFGNVNRLQRWRRRRRRRTRPLTSTHDSLHGASVHVRTWARACVCADARVCVQLGHRRSIVMRGKFEAAWRTRRRAIFRTAGNTRTRKFFKQQSSSFPAT